MSAASTPAFGSGDTYLHLDVLPDDLSKDVFARVKQEVQWSVMHHRGAYTTSLSVV